MKKQICPAKVSQTKILLTLVLLFAIAYLGCDNIPCPLDRTSCSSKANGKHICKCRDPFFGADSTDGSTCYKFTLVQSQSYAMRFDFLVDAHKIAAVTPEACREECVASGRCVVFSYNHDLSLCMYSSQVPVSNIYSQGFVSYVREVCSRLPPTSAIVMLMACRSVRGMRPCFPRIGISYSILLLTRG